MRTQFALLLVVAVERDSRIDLVSLEGEGRKPESGAHRLCSSEVGAGGAGQH